MIMDKEGLTLEQIKEIYARKINDTYTLNLAVSMLENYDELLKKYEEKDKEIERLEEELQQEKKDFKETNDYCFELKDYKSRCEKANALLNEMLERAYIDGEYIMYDYSTSELLELKQALQGEDKDD